MIEFKKYLITEDLQKNNESFTNLINNSNINTDIINNILDKNPPLNGRSINYVPGNANTYPSYYDPLGRFIYLNISKRIY